MWLGALARASLTLALSRRRASQSRRPATRLVAQRTAHALVDRGHRALSAPGTLSQLFSDTRAPTRAILTSATSGPRRPTHAGRRHDTQPVPDAAQATPLAGAEARTAGTTSAGTRSLSYTRSVALAPPRERPSTPALLATPQRTALVHCYPALARSKSLNVLCSPPARRRPAPSRLRTAGPSSLGAPGRPGDVLGSTLVREVLRL